MRALSVALSPVLSHSLSLSRSLSPSGMVAHQQMFRAIVDAGCRAKRRTEIPSWEAGGEATIRPSAPQRRWLQDGFYSGVRDLRPAHAQMHAHTHTHTRTRPCAYARARTLAAHYTSGGPPCCVSCMTVFFLDYSLMNRGIGTVPTYTSCIRME